MKTLFIGLLLGIIIGVGGLWYLSRDQTTGDVQQAEERVAGQVEQAFESVQDLSEQAKQEIAVRLDALDLRPEDIQKELAEQGRIVRRKARDIGEDAADVARDAQTTAEIKAKLVADPELSALNISVSTTAGLVTLSGTAASLELIGSAMALALGTEGVREVVSTIQVE
ncbi:MAG TPA: BON domain-containing protein [Desulfonatronum sp.]|nr:BON domain-containing protein [Desulfonatronum sp.]